MALILELATRNAMADAIDDQVNLGTAPILRFETSGDAQLATLNLNATAAFSAATVGVITLADVPLSDTNATAGTCAQFSIYASSNGTSKVLEGSVDTAGGSGDITLSSLVIGSGDTVTLSAFTITVPAS